MNLAVLESEEAVRAGVPDLGYIRDLEADGLVTAPHAIPLHIVALTKTR